MRIQGNWVQEIEKRLTPSKPSVGSAVESFSQSLSDALQNLNRSQLQSSANMESSIRGDGLPLHQVLAQSQEAGLAFQLSLQFRNKALEAYQEVLRMQF